MDKIRKGLLMVIKVGIAGTGFNIGRASAHVKSCQNCKDTELAALYDVVPGRSAEWAEKKDIKNVTICDTYEQMLDMVDAVVVSASNSAHTELAVAAIKKHKHGFPFAFLIRAAAILELYR